MGITIEKQQGLCIWTEAGVLNGKICDRDFQCERCPLDAALRERDGSCLEDEQQLDLTDVNVTVKKGLPDSAMHLLSPFIRLQISPELQYSAKHMWVRMLASGKVRCGLDAFAATLLPEDAQLVMVANETCVREGEDFGWVYGGSHTIPLSAPVSGTVSCRNTELFSTVRHIRQSPYQRGCIVTISPEIASLANAHLSSAQTQTRRIRKQVLYLSQRISEAISSPDIGVCLNDGGTEVRSIRSLMGEQGYWELLARFVGG
jgi:glycine cleavage system H lipoate-binding protein